MPRMSRKNFAATLALTTGALLGVAGFAVPGRAVAATGPAALTDPVGDTINRNTNEKLASGAADIVAATVESGPGGVVLTFKTQELTDPVTDPNWASGNTFVSWQLDGNNDQKPETLIRYSLDRDAPGTILGEVTYWPGPGVPAKHCDAKSTFNPATGYSMTFDPSCMGTPAAVSYRVQLTYDTKPGPAGTKTPLAFDVVPDTGLAGPVPIVVATAPAAAPPAPAPSGSPDPAPGQAAPPAAGAPSPSQPGAAPGAKNAPKPTPKPTAPARTPSSAAPKPAAPAPAAGPSADPSAELAATGPNGARWLGALGGALMLLGGLGLMTPADRRRQTAA
jgi:hypothetical protein